MTEAQQRRFYFPCWNSCAVANGWSMVKGRLREPVESSKLRVQSWSEPAREMCLKVLTMAEQLALQDHGAVTAVHLRRSCNLIAGGKASSFDLDNKQTNRVVALFKLLTDPDDLDAVMNWLHPENAERGSFVTFLKKRAHEGTLIAIAKNAFGTSDWESLEISKLRWIAKNLKDRKPATRKIFYRQQLARLERHTSGKQYDPANAAF